MNETAPLLPDGTSVAFGDIEPTLAEYKRSIGAGRALTATVVAVGPHERLTDAAATMRALAESGAVRAVLISQGGTPDPRAWVSGSVVALQGLRPSFVDNAVAALRLSSLPTLVWWRGGAEETLDGIAALADRVVLDAGTDVWPHAAALVEKTAVGDLRWTRLTRWRALMSHFFDMPGVAQSPDRFTSLRIVAGDRDAAALFAAWIGNALGLDGRLRVEVRDSGGEAALEEVRLGDGAEELVLRLAKSRRCVESAARLPHRSATSRIVSLGNQSLESLLLEELRIRARDAAFETALRTVVGS